jgi:hypothetical protein
MYSTRVYHKVLDRIKEGDPVDTNLTRDRVGDIHVQGRVPPYPLTPAWDGPSSNPLITTMSHPEPLCLLRQNNRLIGWHETGQRCFSGNQIPSRERWKPGMPMRLVKRARSRDHM